MAREFLSTYLNDHLAGAQAAIEILSLLRKLRGGEVWEGIEVEIYEDRGELKRLMTAIDSSPSAVRRAAAWTAEKLAELKMVVDDPSSGGTLRRLELIEALAIGIDGKTALWKALQRASEATSGLADLDYPRLITRAESQRRIVEGERLDAAAEAFRP